MSLQRFFVPPTAIAAGTVTFPAETAKQITSVLRMRRGHKLVVLNNAGVEYMCELDLVSKAVVTAVVLEEKPAPAPLTPRLHMALALTQREKFEWMLQKCTELGAAAFYPLVTRRSLVQSPADVMKHVPRWERIIQEAAEQCERGDLPVLHPPAAFEAGLRAAGEGCDLRLIAWEEEARGQARGENSVRTVLNKRNPGRVCMGIGPEGGFETREVEAARGLGFAPVSLGRNILRMETAAVAAAALVMLGG